MCVCVYVRDMRDKQIGTSIGALGHTLSDSLSDLVSTKGGSEKNQEMTTRRDMVRPIDHQPFTTNSHNEVPFPKNSFSDNSMMGMAGMGMGINSTSGYYQVENFVGGNIHNV